MSAATGDPVWEARYVSFEPQLDATIKEAEQLAPAVYSGEGAAQTNEANLSLVAMEHRAFDLVRVGQTEAASQLLFSQEYEEQQGIYARGNEEIALALQKSGERSLAAARRDGIWITIILATAVPLLLVAWFAVLRSIDDHVRERRRAERDLERALATEQDRARRDPFTGVLNHGAILDDLRQLLAERQPRAPIAVAMADVDGLKEVNDAYGHPVGDAVLLAVADALSRDGVMVGRYGGDEFMVIIPGADEARAERYRDDVRDQLARISIGDPKAAVRVAVGASIGFAHYPGEAVTVDHLIKLSDSAMYATRRSRPGARTTPRRAPRTA